MALLVLFGQPDGDEEYMVLLEEESIEDVDMEMQLIRGFKYMAHAEVCDDVYAFPIDTMMVKKR